MGGHKDHLKIFIRWIYKENTDHGLIMITVYDVILIALSFIMMLGALLLVRPKTSNHDALKLRKLRHKAEKDQRVMAEVLKIIEHGARDTEYLSNQLKARVEDINQQQQGSQTHAEEANRVLQKAIVAENELSAISTQLSERIQQVQNYWDRQLDNTSTTVKNIETKLQTGLTHVDDGLVRLREQEKMAQGFTQKLTQHQQEHLVSQQKNAQLSGQMHEQLETIFKASTIAFQTVQEHSTKSEATFNKYAKTVAGLEQQAHGRFAEVFQSADIARNELNASLKEASTSNEKLRDYEKQSLRMSSRIKEQFAQVNGLRVDRLTETVSLTDEMCENLQEGLENARALLATLDAKTAEVINAHTDSNKEEAPAPAAQRNNESEKPRNLFSLRAYR